MIILRLILTPFSILYGTIIQIRNLLYNKGFLRVTKIEKPVISIGNITTGGTGKTPLTIFVAEHFLDNGKTVGIVSRGYKRNSNEVLIVSDGSSIAEPDVSGDELNMISRSLAEKYSKKFFAAAAADRIEASKLLINLFNPDVIILDDAFQHRRIYRDLDIVILDSFEYTNNKFDYSIPIPSGTLREFFGNIKRANLVINNHKSYRGKLAEYNGSTNITMRYKTEYIIDYKNGILDKSKFNRKIIAFAGIAKFESFENSLKQYGLSISETIIYPDHHRYSNHDISFLKKRASPEAMFVTTEKDFVKLRQYDDFVNDYPVFFAKIKLEIEDKNNNLNKQLDKIVK